jgi:hypothetical protein
MYLIKFFVIGLVLFSNSAFAAKVSSTLIFDSSGCPDDEKTDMGYYFENVKKKLEPLGVSVIEVQKSNCSIKFDNEQSFEGVMTDIDILMLFNSFVDSSQNNQ